MNRVRTAVIPAAGLGTRMRPATVAVPKELLPVGRRPAIDWVLDEAQAGGIEHAIVVTNRSKPALRSYLASRDVSPVGYPRTRDGFRVTFIEQSSPHGLGDAVLLAHRTCPSESLAVMLPDEVMFGGPLLMAAMLEHFEHEGSSVVGVMHVPENEVSSYGCVSLADGVSHGSVHITGCVEKPHRDDAPSTLAICGRYVLGRDVLDDLASVEEDSNGEVQLTTAIDVSARRRGVLGVEVLPIDGRHDIGNWSGWLDANAVAFRGLDLAFDTGSHPALSKSMLSRVA